MKKWMLFLAFLVFINKVNSQIVVICTGEYAQVYHSRENCTGLNNCKGDIIKVFQSDAINKYKLQRPCCVCWFPSPIGCATDDLPKNNQITKFNPYVPQFSSEEEMKLYAYANAKKKEEEARAMAAGAVLIAASGVGLIVVSNDFYVHKTIPISYKADDLNNISTQGFDFGFRIRFKKSALEYGATIYDEKNMIGNMMTYNPNTKSYVSTKNYITSSQYFGYNLAYNHSIFKPLTNLSNTKFYLGAALNGIFTERHKVGFSGQFGFNSDLIKRIKLDSRVEIGNYTKEIKIGLIYNYKKRKEERLYN